MKKILKILAILLGILFLGGAVLYFAVHEKEPQGEHPDAADTLAREMLEAIDVAAWDTTRWVRWSYPPGHHYLWDKARDLVRVQWNDYSVVLQTTTQQGYAVEGGANLEGKKAEKALQKAWQFFCNDSFWLNAPAKCFDPGTTRSLVTLKDGRQGLKVQYSSGGVTPGDAYVWLLDENNRPTSWKMWVKILPVGGLEFTWENWTQLSSGAWIAQNHQLRNIDLELTNLAGGELDAVGLAEDPFSEFAF